VPGPTLREFTLGLEVLVQDVMAAIRISPLRSLLPVLVVNTC
jgi:hypothetical protein